MLNEKDQLAGKVVDKMMDHDAFSQWMDVKVLDIKEGYSKIQMTIRKEMVNGFGIVHGGLPFSWLIPLLLLHATIVIIYLWHLM
jgi:acyl-CoA thioesterase